MSNYIKLNNRHIAVVLFVILFSTYKNTYSQEYTANDIKKVNILKLNLTSIFLDPISSYQISYEYHLKGKFNLEHEIGYITRYTPNVALNKIFNDNHYLPINIDNLNGIRIRHELKYFFQNFGSYRAGEYFSTELIWTYYEIIGDYAVRYGSSTIQYYIYDDLDIRQSAKLHFKLGYQFNVKKNMIIDGFGGFGAKYILNGNYPLKKDIQFTLTVGLKMGIFLKNRQSKDAT
ncbi:MAG TPA: hypothetical protein DDX39_07075 [Bacteroidales bacterium]|nr:MAG: hypothetical protein A2W98_12200 [Bacteroidetes bacterium GWF2_33_38]HBF88391.1 hypothetical protein [Bacteroidales bacterium]